MNVLLLLLVEEEKKTKELSDLVEEKQKRLVDTSGQRGFTVSVATAIMVLLLVVVVGSLMGVGYWLRYRRGKMVVKLLLLLLLLLQMMLDSCGATSAIAIGAAVGFVATIVVVVVVPTTYYSDTVGSIGPGRSVSYAAERRILERSTATAAVVRRCRLLRAITIT